MKTLALTLIAALAAGTAMAGPFGLPDHQPDGYRDTGCDPAKQVQITNDAGKYLYSNNPTCPDKSGTVGWVKPSQAATPTDPTDPGDDGAGPGDSAEDDTSTKPVQVVRPGWGWGDDNHDHKDPPGKKG